MSEVEKRSREWFKTFAAEHIAYDPETGRLWWKKKPNRQASVGKEIGSKNPEGYLYFYSYGRRYKAHRVAWLLVHGEWPSDQIDHINGVRTDNRISNLRAVDQSTNMENMRGARKSNKSGFLGVHLYAPHRRKPYKATICIKGKTKALGVYETAEMAHSAYLKVKRELHKGCTI